MRTEIILIAAALALTGCEKSGSDTAEKSTNASSSPLTAPSDYLSAIQKGQVSAEKTTETASINKAIQLFNIENGRNPKDLNELVAEKFLPAIPKPPYGTELKYDATSGKVSIVPKPAQP